MKLNTKTISITMPPELFEKLQEEKIKTGIGVSVILRQLALKWLKEEKRNDSQK
ncbi:MAG TPA: ribbon-helix-helix domain-containing protein [Caldisericia bacterium]|jgi:predicted DNA-binding protein|nr:ribbon-helix-helix domain-containing protein [Caldisericia bacterium]